MSDSTEIGSRQNIEKCPLMGWTDRVLLSKRGPYTKAVTDGASHNYKGYDKEVADPIISWLRSRG